MKQMRDTMLDWLNSCKQMFEARLARGPDLMCDPYKYLFHYDLLPLPPIVSNRSVLGKPRGRGTEKAGASWSRAHEDPWSLWFLLYHAIDGLISSEVPACPAKTCGIYCRGKNPTCDKLPTQTCSFWWVLRDVLGIQQF